MQTGIIPGPRAIDRRLDGVSRADKWMRCLSREHTYRAFGRPVLRSTLTSAGHRPSPRAAARRSRTNVLRPLITTSAQRVRWHARIPPRGMIEGIVGLTCPCLNRSQRCGSAAAVGGSDRGARWGLRLAEHSASIVRDRRRLLRGGRSARDLVDRDPVLGAVWGVLHLRSTRSDGSRDVQRQRICSGINRRLGAAADEAICAADAACQVRLFRAVGVGSSRLGHRIAPATVRFGDQSDHVRTA